MHMPVGAPQPTSPHALPPLASSIARVCAGASEVLRGAAESRSLERLDLSQNHIADDVVDWAAPPGPDSSAVVLRNTTMAEIDMSFNWVQVRRGYGTVRPWRVALCARECV